MQSQNITMLEHLKQYIKENNLIAKGDKIIVALSGGIDSMVLTHLMKEYGNHFVAAHCNFHLRDIESDGDEQFVTKYCLENGIKCHVKHFNTKEYAQEKNISIEMAARELRYTWFEELKQELGYDKIAVAHHADDQIETFFINLLRGSGIHGLKAMLPANAAIIRPLLWSTRKQIKEYAEANNISWRNDSTNDETIFTRNKLRNIVLPYINTHFGNASRAMTNSINHLTSECCLYDQLVSQYIDSVQIKKDNSVTIEKSTFKSPNGKQLLFEWIKQYNFNTSQCEDISKALPAKPGQNYYSPTHRLCIGRNNIVIDSIINKSNLNPVTIKRDTTKIAEPIKMELSILDRNTDFSINKDKNCGMLDYDKIEYPLCLRLWKHGDKFKPLGMSGTKLVSDFLTGLHLTQTDKDKIFVLENGDGRIIWLVGLRIDDRFKIDDKTKHVLAINTKV